MLKLSIHTVTLKVGKLENVGKYLAFIIIITY